MKTLMRLSKRLLAAAMWIPIGTGISVWGFSLPAMYLVLSGQATPGELMFLDLEAPTIPDSLRTLGFASLLLLIGFGVRSRILRDLDREMLDSGI